MLLQITVTSKCITFREKECEHPLTIFSKKIVKHQGKYFILKKKYKNNKYWLCILVQPGQVPPVSFNWRQESSLWNLIWGRVWCGVYALQKYRKKDWWLSKNLKNFLIHRPFYRNIKLLVSCTFGLHCARQTLITCLIRARSFCLIVPGGWQEATLPQFYFHSPSRSAHEIKFY